MCLSQTETHTAASIKVEAQYDLSVLLSLL